MVTPPFDKRNPTRIGDVDFTSEADWGAMTIIVTAVDTRNRYECRHAVPMEQLGREMPQKMVAEIVGLMKRHLNDKHEATVREMVASATKELPSTTPSTFSTGGPYEAPVFTVDEELAVDPKVWEKALEVLGRNPTTVVTDEAEEMKPRAPEPADWGTW